MPEMAIVKNKTVIMKQFPYPSSSRQASGVCVSVCISVCLYVGAGGLYSAAGQRYSILCYLTVTHERMLPNLQT